MGSHDMDKPDAVYIVRGKQQPGADASERIRSTVLWAEGVLGSRPVMAAVDAGYILAVPDKHGVVAKYLPGQGPKYRWVPVEDGIEHGFLLNREDS